VETTTSVYHVTILDKRGTDEWVFSSFETPVKLLMNGLGDRPVDQTSRPYGTTH
jgi:hypothetical protein